MPQVGQIPTEYTPHAFPTYYIHDHLGNTRITYRNLFECSGTGQGGTATHYMLQHLHDYFPYGKTLREWSPDNGNKEEYYLTTQHQRDFETNFDHRGARLYDADAGRFLSLDPLAADYPSWSDYNYVLGNPISLVDPDGRHPVAVLVIAKGVITGFAVGAGIETAYQALESVVTGENRITVNKIVISGVGGSFTGGGAAVATTSKAATSFASNLLLNTA